MNQGRLNSPREIFLCALTGLGGEGWGVALSFDTECRVLPFPESPLLAHDAFLSLQVGELPGVVVGLGALAGEGLPEVYFDQLPVWPVADVAEHAVNKRTRDDAKMYIRHMSTYDAVQVTQQMFNECQI